MSGDISGCHNWDEGGVAPGIQSVQVRDATKLPIMHRTAPMTKNYPTQSSIEPRLKEPYGIWILQISFGGKRKSILLLKNKFENFCSWTPAWI